MRLRHILTGAVVIAVALLGGLWLFLRAEPPSEARDAFQEACVAAQRQHITGTVSGAPLPLDDESEARLLAYCDCVMREAGTRLTSREIADIGLEQSDPATGAKLSVIFDRCRAGNP